MHRPVLLREVVSWLGPALGDNSPLVDCTVGGGGHSEAFLERFPSLRLIGIDRDSQALRASKRRLERFGPRVVLVKRNFSELAEVLREFGHNSAGAVFYDLGVSSYQLDRPERGFQFRAGSPLDMRMDIDLHQTAADLVNNYSESELNRLIANYGEERFASRIAKAIVRRRDRRPFTDGADLADVIKEAIPAATRRSGPHPARRTFQALRIEVNDELTSLRDSLKAAVEIVEPGGRIGAISYHSLEDRIVKGTFRDFSAGCVCPRDFPVCRCETKAKLRVLTRRPVRPAAEERAGNPRSDSARMRVAEALAVATNGPSLPGDHT